MLTLFFTVRKIMPSSLQPSAPPQEPSLCTEPEETFRPPFGLKLFLGFFVLLGVIILLDTITRFFR